MNSRVNVDGVLNTGADAADDKEWKRAAKAFNLLFTTLPIALFAVGHRMEMSHAIKRESACTVPK